jgi:hypothetical protein
MVMGAAVMFFEIVLAAPGQGRFPGQAIESVSGWFRRLCFLDFGLLPEQLSKVVDEGVF